MVTLNTDRMNVVRQRSVSATAIMIIWRLRGIAVSSRYANSPKHRSTSLYSLPDKQVGRPQRSNHKIGHVGISRYRRRLSGLQEYCHRLITTRIVQSGLLGNYPTVFGFFSGILRCGQGIEVSAFCPTYLLRVPSSHLQGYPMFRPENRLSEAFSPEHMLHPPMPFSSLNLCVPNSILYCASLLRQPSSNGMTQCTCVDYKDTLLTVYLLPSTMRPLSLFAVARLPGLL